MWPGCHHVLPSPPACSPSVWKFSIRPVLWQSCFLQRMSVVRNYWREQQLKAPGLCSGGSSLAEVVFLGMGVGKWPVALASVCGTRLALKAAGGPPWSWLCFPGNGRETVLLYPATPKTCSQDSPPQTLVGLSVPLCVSLGCSSVHFLEFLSPRDSTLPRRVQLSLQQLLGWGSSCCMEPFSGLLGDTCAPHLGQLSSWDENWVQFPENNFSYFNMRW